MASLALTKLVSGAQADKVNDRFAFAIDCGGDGLFNVDLGSQLPRERNVSCDRPLGLHVGPPRL